MIGTTGRPGLNVVPGEGSSEVIQGVPTKIFNPSAKQLWKGSIQFFLTKDKFRVMVMRESGEAVIFNLGSFS